MLKNLKKKNGRTATDIPPTFIPMTDETIYGTTTTTTTTTVD
jgi:hypothetical protein